MPSVAEGATTRGPTPAVIVFLHGYLGFVQAPFLPFVKYFRGLEAEMRRLGHACLFPALPRTESVATRAAALAGALDATGERPIVLVGHSMGGLDARFLARERDPRRRVRTVVSVGTPHRGSPVADWALSGELSFPWSLVGRWRPALEDLTPEACDRRNERLIDREDVTYLSCAGMRPPSHLPWPLADYARRMQPAHGDNDGLVSVESARWGGFLGVHQADHVELIGWRLPRWAWTKSRPFDHLRLYRNLIRQALAAPDAPDFDDVQGD